MGEDLPQVSTGIIPNIRRALLGGGAAGAHTLSGLQTIDKIISVWRLSNFRRFSQSLDVASVAANTTAEQTFTVAGLAVGDIVIVNKPALDAGLGIVNARVSAADTLALTFVNATGAPIDPAAETYEIIAIRPVPVVADLTSEFSISAADTLDNTGGTDTTGDLLFVVYQDADWGVDEVLYPAP